MTRASGSALKRTCDIVMAVTCLVIFAPVAGGVALVIWLDSGRPILFRQERVGKYGRTFKMLKFRTMRPDRRLRASDLPPGVSERRRVHKSPSDPRVTRVGRFLRRSCLDELPQFWNVLRGEMSIVGPRPELPEIVAKYQPWQHARHQVSPGITGWWQVNRSDGVLMHEATLLDLYYVEHASLWLDLRILARTAAIVLRGVGAF
jgi:lipopolysaccharide/colanic/teichoic acid biosynthesis glycosyltransferase